MPVTSTSSTYELSPKAATPTDATPSVTRSKSGSEKYPIPVDTPRLTPALSMRRHSRALASAKLSASAMTMRSKMKSKRRTIGRRHTTGGLLQTSGKKRRERTVQLAERADVPIARAEQTRARSQDLTQPLAPDILAALSLEGLRAKVMYEHAKAVAKWEASNLSAMNLKSIALAHESEVLDVDIQIAQRDAVGIEEIDRLNAAFQQHCEFALEEVRERERGRAPGGSAGLGMFLDLPPMRMNSPYVSQISSSPLRRLNGPRSSPMSGINVIED